MERSLTILIGAVCVLATDACVGYDSSASTASSVGGPAIVENVERLWTDTEVWRVGDDPAVVIGVQSGDPRYQFAQIAGAAWLQDGRIVVADAGDKEVRYFEADGTHLLTVGREGEGPGEFVNLSLAGTVGDTVIAWDSRQNRLTVVGPRGEIERVVPLSRSDGGSIAPRVLGVLSDGNLIASFPTALSRIPADGEVLRDSLRLWHFDYRSGQRRLIVNMPSFEAVYWRGEPYQSLLITLAPKWTIHADQIYIAPATAPEIDVFGLDGTLRLRARRAVSLEPTSTADKELIQRIARQQAQPDAEDVTGAMAHLPIPEHLPPYDRLIVDEEGNIWARRFRSPSDPDWRRPYPWTVFRPDGVLLGEVEIPSQLDVREVRSGAILGVWSDELGVDYVRVYPLLKPLKQRTP
jgi:hypothetical protein